MAEDRILFWCGEAGRRDEIFPRIARAAPSCRLAFAGALPERAFAAYGLAAADHCVAAPLAACDIVLDTAPWAERDLITECLSRALPIASLAGQRGAALLARLDLGDLVAETLDALATLTVRLACDGEFRARVRDRIRDGKTRLAADDSLARAVALESAGRLAEAAAAYRAALALDDHAAAHNNLGNILRRLGDAEAADIHINRALTLDPTLAEGWTNLGLLAGARGDRDAAIAHHRHAIALQPALLAAHTNLGNTLHGAGFHDEAEACYAQALTLAPNSAETHWNLGLVQLLHGRYAEGWENFAWRWRPDFPSRPRAFDVPQWRGEPLDGARILLHSEQGFGDGIQFARYAPFVAARGLRVILDVPPDLKALFQTLAGVEAVLTRGDVLPDFAVHCPLTDLGRAFGTTVETIPASVPYLAADPARVAAMAARLGPRRGLRVGLVWAGRPQHARDRDRSLPPEALGPLATCDDIEFVSLQKDTVDPPPGLPITDLAPALRDFADTAAAIASLDLVISVDTAVAHLAGALGKEVWVLLPLVPDWRWLIGRETSPWYPTARLFRQEREGDWAAVIARVAAVLNKRAQDPALLHRLGVAAYLAGDHAKAADRIARALDRAPENAEAHANLGLVLDALGRREEAIARQRRALQLRPGFAAAHNNLGRSLEGLGHRVEAEVEYRKAVALDPALAEAQNNLANLLKERGAFDEAIALYETAIALKPSLAELHRNHGLALQARGDLASAIAAFRQARGLAPERAASHFDLANALRDQGALEPAVASYERALTREPRHADTHCNLGIAFHLQAMTDAADACFAQALALDPDHTNAHLDRGMNRLLTGDYAGLADYEWRFRAAGIAPCDFGVPQWQGEPLDGAPILLHAEQGFGDTIQFARYAPLVAARGGRVTIEAPQELVRLLASLPGAPRVIEAGTPPGEIAFHCPVASLPLACGTTRATIPAAIPYLAADPALAAEGRARVGSAPGLKVGLVSAGRPSHPRDRERSLAPELLAPLAAVPGITWVSLQKDQEAPEGFRRIAAGPELADFAATAAVIAALDLVIAVDTAVAHLAGALGKPVWLLLTQVPDWRWGLFGETTPWYPTARLIRQKRRGEWAPVIGRVARLLTQAVTEDALPERLGAAIF